LLVHPDPGVVNAAARATADFGVAGLGTNFCGFLSDSFSTGSSISLGFKMASDPSWTDYPLD
jgi:hypothetical protein